MTDLYIIQNQYQQFLAKHGEWVEQAQGPGLYRTAHKDEAINMKVEQSVRNPELRLTIVLCALNDKGHLVIDDASHDQRPILDPAPAGLFTASSGTASQGAAAPIEQAPPGTETA